jgi:chemotaxis protein methyltransferase CheR
MLARARGGCFDLTSLHELPSPLVDQAFDRVGSQYCVQPKHREGIEFLEQDLRTEMPPHLFDIILCRYVAFTYFAVPLQRKVLVGMLERLRPRGYLVVGTHEQLPDDVPELVSLGTARQIFQKRAVPHAP